TGMGVVGTPVGRNRGSPNAAPPARGRGERGSYPGRGRARAPAAGGGAAARPRLGLLRGPAVRPEPVSVQRWRGLADLRKLCARHRTERPATARGRTGGRRPALLLSGGIPVLPGRPPLADRRVAVRADRRPASAAAARGRPRLLHRATAVRS